jgi:uncharacterized phiE125 gp8 family phage protein
VVNLTVVVQPPFEPVTLSDVYKHLRLDTEGSPETHPDDTRLTRHIEAARRHVETMTRRALIEQTLRLSMPMFPFTTDAWFISTSRNTLTRRIQLHRPPFVSVTSVQYYDGDNALQTLATSDYYVTDEQVPELRFVSAFSTPTVYDRPDAVRVTYRVGYTPEGSPPTTQEEYAGNVPAGLKDAILIGVQLLYDDLRPEDFKALEMAQESLVQPFRIQLLP